MSVDKKSLVAFAKSERDRFERTLCDLVEIPTVSADPDRAPDIRRAANRAAQLIREFGGEASMLATDSIIVSDTIWVSRAQPACPAGLRGLQGFELFLETGETDQHSGTAGGAARNPIGELMKLVSEMYDATTGRVKIKGFYDDAVPPSKAEIAEFRRSGFSVRQFKKDHLYKKIRTEDPLDVMKRIWAMPTFEVHGVVGG